jgi:hypothetical protein
VNLPGAGPPSGLGPWGNVDGEAADRIEARQRALPGRAAGVLQAPSARRTDDAALTAGSGEKQERPHGRLLAGPPALGLVRASHIPRDFTLSVCASTRLVD